MTKTKVFLLVPTYAGVTGTIQAAYNLAANVDANGPIQFHMVDYPEENPKSYMIRDDDWDGMDDIDPSVAFSMPPPPPSSMMNESWNQSLEYARDMRKWIETPDEVLLRMADAEDWFYSTSREDKENS